MQRLEQVAEFSVARGSGFAALAILTFIVGLLGEPQLALKIGAALALLASMVLVIKAVRVRSKPYRSTEVWLLLEAHERPPAAVAQRLVATALREAYLRFALYFASGAGGLLVATLVLGLVFPR